MTVRPRIGVLVGKGVLAEVKDEATAARLEERFELVWPAGNGIGPDEARRLLAGASGCITGWGSPVLAAELLAVAPALRIVAHAAGTVKPVVSEALWERGIVVTCAAGAIAVDVAQYAVALMVIGRKNVMELAPLVAAGRWSPTAGRRRPGDLRGCTVGVIGASRVGRAVLGLLARYDVAALLADPYVTAEEAGKLGARAVALDDLFRLSDVVT
ncbi:MAG: NAD(P)-dependent oxidoreductase, partial [bacterium]